MQHAIPSGTREWSTQSCNLQTGCENDCVYCYAKAGALRFKRCKVDTWKEPTKAKRNLKLVVKPGRLMIPTTHDITLHNVDAITDTIKQYAARGGEVLIVSKPRYSVIALLCNSLFSYKDKILFRFTIGSMVSNTLRFWEPGAPDFPERLACLAMAYYQDFGTSVSCEPLLASGIPEVKDMVKLMKPYVTDSIWIGPMNHSKARISTNTGVKNGEHHREADMLQCVWQCDSFFHLHKQCGYDNDPKIKWKESVKKMLGLEGSQEIGHDT